MTHYIYHTQLVCSKEIHYDVEDGKLHNVRFFGGCPGNLFAIGKLIEGKDAKQVADLLRGNDCARKGTSCADQLAKAIEQALGE